ncbi:site-specific integrase [bacterium]|nr:site-specific integrase [bacterium]
MRLKPNREGGYEWMRAEEVIALLKVLKEGGSREVQRSGGRQQTVTMSPHPQTWALIFFMVHTGARLSEAHALRWADVDLEARTIRLIGGMVRGAVQPIQARTIPMCDEVFRLFASLPAGDPEQLVFERDEKLHRTMKLAFQCAGLPYYKLAALRDTMASHLSINGVKLEDIAKLLGHRSLKAVQRYAHLCPPVDLVAEVRKLNFAVQLSDQNHEPDPIH